MNFSCWKAVSLQDTMLREQLNVPPAEGEASSSRLTLSRFDVFESRLDKGDKSRCS